MATEKQWTEYQNAVFDLEEALDRMMTATDDWVKYSAPITDADNIKDTLEFRKQVKEYFSDLIEQYRFDEALYRK